MADAANAVRHEESEERNIPGCSLYWQVHPASMDQLATHFLVMHFVHWGETHVFSMFGYWKMNLRLKSQIANLWTPPALAFQKHRQ